MISTSNKNINIFLLNILISVFLLSCSSNKHNPILKNIESSSHKGFDYDYELYLENYSLKVIFRIKNLINEDYYFPDSQFITISIEDSKGNNLFHSAKQKAFLTQIYPLEEKLYEYQVSSEVLEPLLKDNNSIKISISLNLNTNSIIIIEEFELE